MNPEQREEAYDAFTERMNARPELEPLRGTRRPTMAVPKRRITPGERHASTVEAIAKRVVARWPKVESVAAALAMPTVRAAGSQDGRGKGGHADPVAANVLHRVGGVDDEEDPSSRDRIVYEDVVAAVQAWLEQGKWIEAQQIRYLKEHPEAAAQRLDDLKSLCVEAGCDFRAERAGRCWKHYREHLAAAQENGSCAASTHPAHEPVLETAASNPRTATVWCHQCPADFPVPSGVDPVGWLEQHRTREHGA